MTLLDRLIGTGEQRAALWTLHGEIYFRSDVLWGYPQLIASYGQDYRDLLERVGISHDAIDNPNLFISWVRHGQFLELAAERCGEPDLGLRHALNLPKTYPNSGPLLLLAQICTDLRDWINRSTRYARLHTNAWVPCLSFTASGDALFRLADSPTFIPPRQQSEALVAKLLFVVREILQRPDIAPKTVRFKHSKPQSIGLHQQIFGCSVEFGCSYNEMIFDPTYLDLKVVSNFSRVREFMDIYLRREIRKIVNSHGSIGSAVAAAVPIMLGTELCSAEGVAATLGMTEKKMQRLLRDEGTSFRTIFQSVRRELAENLLANTMVNLDIIGNLLGYSAPTAFSLAFRNWTGMPPGQFRAERQQEAERKGTARAAGVVRP